MFWKYFAVFVFIVFSFLAFSQPAYAAQDCPGSYSASTAENVLTSQSRIGQQYTHSLPADLISVTMNVMGSVGHTGFLQFQIHETTAGLPNSTIVPGSAVQIAGNLVPDRAIGTAQKFSCNSLPPNTTFTFASPISLTPGVMYAFVVYGTTFEDAQNAIFTGDFPGLVPGAGVKCVGSPCISHTGWALNNSGGFPYDNVYSVENEFVDGSLNDTDIDGKILRFREYLQLTGDAGGIIFTVALIGLIFLVGLGFKVPFIITGMTATMIIASFARANVVEPWIVLAVIAVAGMAMVFKIAGSGGSEDEI